MNPYEEMRHQIFPSHWHSEHMVMPESIGSCHTVFPYYFSRSNNVSYLLLFTLSGEGCLEYGGISYPLHPGDLFFIDCFHPQVYKAVAESWDFAYIHLPKQPQIGAYYAAITQNGRSPVFRYPPFFPDCWDKLKQEAEDSNPGSRMRASLRLVSLLLNLAELGTQDVPGELKEVADHIKTHYDEPISIDMLAKIAHLSKYYFIRQFKRFYRVTPHEYLQLCRMDHAKSQLICTNESIESIAAICGYTSVSAFCNSFKNYNHISPAVFRKQMKIL